MITDPTLENTPFSSTICIGSFDEIFLVQLFSKPQQKPASRINSEPQENCRLVISSKDSTAQDSVTNNIPSQRRELIFSLKTIKAMIAVATISKLLSNEAFAAAVDSNPISKQIGAAMSSRIITIVYGSSDFVSRVYAFVVFLMRRIKSIAIIPTPAPMYKKPAIRVDGI